MRFHHGVSHLAVLGSLLGRPTPVAAQDRADSVVFAALSRYPTPGISIAVTQRGRLIKARGYGFANLELRVPATDSTVYQTGSIGKAFTAALAMTLVQEGKLRVEDPVAKFFPGAPATWQRVRVGHLLTHTSGLADRIYGLVNIREDYSDAQLVRKIATAPVEAPPGARWEYSNQGYHLLGYLISKSQGRFYGDLMQERIFRPLGMDASRIIDEPAIIAHRAAGYELARGTFGPLKNQAYVGPTMNRTGDGSTYSTVLDMAKWDLGLYTDVPLNAKSRAASWTPVRLSNGKTFPYGYGWQTDSVNGHWVVEHSGGWQGFTTHIARYPNDSLGVVVMTNCACGDASKVAHDLAALYLPAIAPTPERPMEPVDPAALALLAKGLSGAAAEVLDPSLFGAAVAAEWPLEARRDWARYLGRVGSLGGITLYSAKPSRTATTNEFRVSIGGIVHRGTAVIRRNGKIESLNVWPE